MFVCAGASPVFTGRGDTMCNMFLCTVALLTELCIFRKSLITNFQIIFRSSFSSINVCINIDCSVRHIAVRGFVLNVKVVLHGYCCMG